MRLLLIFLFTLLLSNSEAQAVSSLPLPAYLGLTANSKRFDDPFSMQVNQASLARVDTPMASLNGERKFLLAELNYCYAALAFPVQSGGVGVALAYNGTTGFSQAKIGVLYAKRLGEKTSLGIALNYHRISIQGYGSAGTVNFSIAFQYEVSKEIIIGFCVENPVAGRLGATGERLASCYSGAIGDRLSEKVFLGLALSKEEASPTRVLMQLQYDATKMFRFLGGISVSSAEAFVGYGIKKGSVQFSQYISWQQSIGVSPALTLVFHVKSLRR